MRFSLQKFGVLSVAVFVACVLCIGTVYLGTRNRVPDIGGSFALTRAGDGKAVTDKDFHGRAMLVYFGYTFCPDVCPTTLADLAIAMKDLGPASHKLQPVFITIDPARDTVPVLKSYLAQFSPDFIGLTGTLQEITSVEKSYKVYAAKTQTGNAPDDYVMDHSSFFYLMGPDGEFRTILPADTDGHALAGELKQYLE